MKRTKYLKMVFAGISGTALQWYDFSLFGYLAPIIATEFFPQSDHTAGLIQSFSIFAIGFLLAPLGSIFFGNIGDRRGRKHALTLSILIMTIPTALVGIIPGYSTIGILAPIILALLRMVQGFVASAEFSGSSVFVVEHAPLEHKHFFGCLTSSAYSVGWIMGSLAAAFFTSSFMPTWGWRIAFCMALFSGAAIFYLRYHADETPAFKHAESNQTSSQLPLLSALREMPHNIFAVLGLTLVDGVMSFGTYVFMTSYLHIYRHLPLSQSILFVSMALVVDATLEPLIATFADKYGGWRVLSIGLVMLGFGIIPLFYGISHGNSPFVILPCLLMLSSIIATVYAPMNAFMVSLFPPHFRYSGYGVSYNTGLAIFGGSAPLAMAWLINSTHDLMSPAILYVIASVVGLGAIYISRAHGFHPHESGPALAES